MFFKSYLISVAARFLWAGLILGLFFMVCKLVKVVSNKNIYISNLTDFCFWLLFGGVFVLFCNLYYSYSFCWFGLLLMLFGLFLVKICGDFFFTSFAKVLYNVLTKKKKGINWWVIIINKQMSTGIFITLFFAVIYIHMYTHIFTHIHIYIQTYI